MYLNVPVRISVAVYLLVVKHLWLVSLCLLTLQLQRLTVRNIDIQRFGSVACHSVLRRGSAPANPEFVPVPPTGSGPPGSRVITQHSFYVAAAVGACRAHTTRWCGVNACQPFGVHRVVALPHHAGSLSRICHFDRVESAAAGCGLHCGGAVSDRSGSAASLPPQ